MAALSRFTVLPLILAAACGGSAESAPFVDDLESPTWREPGGEPSNAFLWRVEGARAPSYLLGTIHLGVDAYRELDPWVWRRLEASRALYIEADLGAIDDASRSLLEGAPRYLPLARHHFWPQFRQLVGPAVADRLAQAPPWLGYSVALRALFPTRHPIDDTVAKHAAERGIPVRTLESARFQLETLARFIDGAELSSLIDENGVERQHLLALIEAYRSGDLGRLQNAAALDSEQDPEHHRVVFADRNRRWAQTLDDELRRGGVFVAVGVGHLFGEDNLIELLRKRGHRVLFRAG